MNEDTLNMQIRKYLKKVGITSQREIEKALDTALKSGKLTGSEQLEATMTLEVPALNLKHRIDGSIALDKE